MPLTSASDAAAAFASLLLLLLLPHPDFCAQFSGTQCRAVNCNATAFTIGYSPINEGGSCTLPNNNPGICNNGNCNAFPPTPSPSPSPSGPSE
jgi:hypothetical protein